MYLTPGNNSSHPVSSVTQQSSTAYLHAGAEWRGVVLAVRLGGGGGVSRRVRLVRGLCAHLHHVLLASDHAPLNAALPLLLLLLLHQLLLLLLLYHLLLLLGGLLLLLEERSCWRGKARLD